MSLTGSVDVLQVCLTETPKISYYSDDLLTCPKPLRTISRWVSPSPHHIDRAAVTYNQAPPLHLYTWASHLKFDKCTFFLHDMRLFHKGFLKFHVRWRVLLKGTVHPNMKKSSFDFIPSLLCSRARALTSDEVRANSFSSAATVNISAYKRASGKLSWHIPRYLHKGMYLKSSMYSSDWHQNPDSVPLFQEFGGIC